MRDFSLLSDAEFETVTGDLLGADLGMNFERFRRAPDGGVDLRAHDPSGTHIVQCKHYQRSRFSDLLRDLKKEVQNVERESPATYRVATSQDLTRSQTDSVYHLFERWMPNTSFVVGGKNIDGLITKYPNIELRYVKLWLASGVVLQGIIHSAIYQRSANLRESIAHALPRYVEGAALDRALRTLDAHRVCIVSGPPGIGKTTLAQVLIARAIKDSYEPVEISHDVEEAWDVFDDGSRQVFYYDDFLGRIALDERLSKNEDHRLSQLIDKVSRSASKLFVLTTREYILEEAKRDYEELSRLDSRLKVVVQLGDYTRLDKAKILYNHLWHAELSRGDLDAVMKDLRYLKIIDHPNFNPRLIEYITKPPIATALG